MTFLICVDDKGGMIFNKRRQSRDREVTARILALCEREGKRLWMNAYSASLFEKTAILIDDDFVAKMNKGDIGFIESGNLPMNKATRLIVYRWNRHYPADTYLPALEECGFIKQTSAEFAGHSHERITEDIYIKQDDSV